MNSNGMSEENITVTQKILFLSYRRELCEEICVSLAGQYDILYHRIRENENSMAAMDEKVVLCMIEIFNLKRQERKKRRLLIEQRRTIDAIRSGFTRQVAEIRNTDRHFARLYDYVQGYCYESQEKKERHYITKKYLCSLFQRGSSMVLERKEAGSLCDLLKFLFLKEELTFAEVKWILSFVEVKENREEAA